MEASAFRKFASVVGGGAFEPSPEDHATPAVARIHADLGRVIEEFSEEASILSEDHRAMGCRGLDLEAGYVIDARCNAWASSCDGKDIVGLALGLFFLVNGLCNLMFAQNPPKLSETAQSVVPQIDLVRELSGEPWHPEPPIATANQKRVTLGRAVKWLLHHELAHIWFGHTALEGVFGPPEKTFIAGPSPCFDPTTVCLEIHADAQATTALLMFEFGMVIEDGSRKFASLDYDSPLWSWHVYSFALAICVGLHALSMRHHLSPIRGTHPPTWFRKKTVLEIIRHSFSDQSESIRDEIERILEIVPKMVARAFGGHFNQDWSANFLDAADYDGHREFFDGFWLILKEQLEPHKRGRFIGNLLPAPVASTVPASPLEAFRYTYTQTVGFELPPTNGS